MLAAKHEVDEKSCMAVYPPGGPLTHHVTHGYRYLIYIDALELDIKCI